MLVTGSVLLARIALWALAVITTIVGICLTVQRTVEVFEYGNFVEAVDVVPVGIALLSVGLLMLAAGLIAEGYLPSAHRASGSASTPDA